MIRMTPNLYAGSALLPSWSSPAYCAKRPPPWRSSQEAVHNKGVDQGEKQRRSPSTRVPPNK
eukprot:7409386-Prorocentrum_lima.AAC.1